MKHVQAVVSRRLINNNLRHGKLLAKRALLALAAGTACEMMFAQSAHAQTYTWTTASGTSNWSVGSNWAGAIAPSSGATTVVDFFDPANTLGPAAGGAVEGDVDSGLNANPFNLNILNLNGTTQAGTGFGTITIGGTTNSLEFAGSSAQINMNALYGAGTGAGTTYDITDPIDFNVTTTITFSASGSGNLNFNDQLSGSGALTIQDNTYGAGGADRPVNINGGTSSSTMFTGNVTVAAGVLQLANVSNLLGPNTAGTQTVTVNPNSSLVLEEEDGAYTENQILVLNGNGTNNGVQIAGELGSDAALDVDSLEYGSSTIGPIVIQTNSTIRVDQNTAAGHPQYDPNWGANAGTLAGTGTLTKVGTGDLYFTEASTATVDGFAPFTGNVVINGGAIVQNAVSNSLGVNPTGGTQTVTVNPGGSFVGYAQYGGTGTISQNLILNGTGTGLVQSYMGTTPTVGLSLGADSALNFDNQIYGSWTVSGNVTIGSSGATVRVNSATGNQSEFGVEITGELEGSGTLNVIGSTGDKYVLAYSSSDQIEAGGWTEFDATANNANGFTGNINIMGNSVVATGHAEDALGTNGSGTQTVTVSAGAAMVLNPQNSHYDNPQNFVINGNGTVQSALFLGSDAALDAYDVNFGNETIGALNVASASTVRVNSDVAAATGLGLVVNGALTGSAPLTVIGGNGAAFKPNQYANIVSQTAGMLEFGATGTYTGNVVISNSSSDNSDSGGTILATGKANDALGTNGSGTQTVTVQSGTTFVLDEGNAAYANPQNIILNGTGSGTSGAGIPVGSDSALEADDVDFGSATVGGLDIQTASTIRVNTDASADTASGPNHGLMVNGPLAGPGALTLVGSAGDEIQNGSFTPETENYGTLILTQAAAAVNGASAITGDGAFSGNVFVGNGTGGGPVLELGPVSDPLGTNSGGTGSQTVTVANGSAVVINGNSGAYANPQYFIVNGTGTGDATTGAVGADAALQAVGIAFGNATIGGLSIATNSTVSVTSTAPNGLTVSTGLAGASGANLTVIGGGTLILSSAAAASSATGFSAFSGNVTVSSATLDVSNSSGSATGAGSVTLTGGTLISDSGAISGNVSADATSVIAPGGIGNIGTLALGGLTTVSGATLNFDLGSGAGPKITNGDLLTISSGPNSIGSGTLLTFGGTSTVGDDYRLIGGTLTGITLANFTLPTAPAGEAYALSTSVDSGFIDLVVSASASGPANLTWNDASSNNLWDTATSSNWNNGSATTIFHAQDNVTFNDSNGSASGRYAVTLSTTVSPGSVMVNNTTGNYSISGVGGSIGGTGALTKSGTGTLTLSTPNTYTGGTSVSAGRLLIEPTTPTSSALAHGALSISGGTVQLADNVTAGTALADSNVNLTSLSMTGSGTLDIGNNRVIVDYSSPATDPIASIAQWIKNGFYNLAGPQIISSDIAADDAASGLSYGIGYADGADHVVAGLPSGEIEIMFTLLGDANLDGTVNTEDFTQFSSHLGQSGQSWDDGDFNYDGTVNTEDFTLFSHNLGESDSLAAAAGTLQVADGLSLSNVPEPASIGLAAIAGFGLLARRRRRTL